MDNSKYIVPGQLKVDAGLANKSQGQIGQPKTNPFTWEPHENFTQEVSQDTQVEFEDVPKSPDYRVFHNTYTKVMETKFPTFGFIFFNAVLLLLSLFILSALQDIDQRLYNIERQLLIDYGKG